MTLVGCWAHARRKYDEALKAAPEANGNPETVAAQGLAYCNQLFAIERELKESTPEERYKAREESSRPVLEAYQTWLRQQKSRIMPKSLIGQAIAYSLNQWDKLTAFLKDGRLEIDLFEQLPQLPDLQAPQALEPFMPWSLSLPVTCRTP